MTTDTSPFTPLFQREMLAQLLQDPAAYSKYNGIWKAADFDDVNHRKIAETFLRVRAFAKEHPTQVSMEQELTGGIPLNKLPMEVQARLTELQTLYTAQLQNKLYTIEKVRANAQNQALKNAVGTAIDHLHSDEYDKIFPLIAAATRVGSAVDESLENVVGDLAEAQIDNSQNILGNRLLERGTFGVIIGHSGAGKSVLTVQAGIELAAGHPILGIAPARALKVLVVQAEDSRNDRIDQVRCLKVLVPDEQQRREMEDRLWMYSTTLRGEELFQKLRELNDKQETPFDLYILNPAFAFLPDGAAAEESKDVSHFLRKLWLPFLKELDAAGLIMHHPPKLNNRDTSKWTVAMFQYAAHGSAEWTNAPRMSMTIEETTSPEVFQFIIGKRGSRSGWKREDKMYARYFKYSDPSEPMHWKEATEDDIAGAQRTDDVTVTDIEEVFEKEGDKLPLVTIREALEADGFKVDNDWLVKKLQRSPRFRKTGNFYTLEKTARQEEKEQKQNGKQEQKEATLESVFETIKTTPKIGVNKLSENLGIRKETLNGYLEKLENSGRIQFQPGLRGAKLYSINAGE